MKKANQEKFIDACNQVTKEQLQNICDALICAQGGLDVDIIRHKTNDLKCVDLAIDVALKNNIDPVQIVGWLKTQMAIASIEVIKQ